MKKLHTILFLFFITSLICCRSIPTEKYTVQKGDFESSITETGELLAVQANTLSAPAIRRQGLQTVIYIIEHGKRVKKGDTVVVLDPDNLLNYIAEEQTRYELEQANLQKLIVQQSNKKKQLEAELKTVSADYNMKKLELEKFQFESDKKKLIKEMEFKQAQIRLNNVNEKTKLEKSISENEMKIQIIKNEQRKNNIKDTRENLEKLTLTTEIDGIAQIRNHWRGGKPIKLGDEVWSGMPLVSIPNISKMKVKSQVNETDIAKIKKGQTVTVRLDAYPKKAFEGVITEISKLSRRKNQDSRVKVFDLEVLVLDSDPALKPGMTVSCEYIYADFKNVLFVPNECVNRTNDGSFIYVKTATGHEQQRVNTGAQNTNFTVLKGAFKEGTPILPVNEISEN